MTWYHKDIWSIMRLEILKKSRRNVILERCPLSINKYKLLSQSDQISHILAWYGINSKSNPQQPGRVSWIKCGGQFASRFWRILRLCWLWSTLSPDFQHFSSICQSRISNQLVKDGRVLSSQPLHVLTAPRHHMHYLALRPIYFGLLGNFRNKAGILQQT